MKIWCNLAEEKFIKVLVESIFGRFLAACMLSDKISWMTQLKCGSKKESDSTENCLAPLEMFALIYLWALKTNTNTSEKLRITTSYLTCVFALPRSDM